MKPKTLKITFWVVTAIFCLANFFSGVAELLPPSEQSLQMIQLLGYPLYFFTILGTAKILGSIAIIQTKYKTVKEWAFAGFTFDYLAASLSFAFVGGGALGVIMPLVFLGVLVAAYVLWKKVDAKA